MRVDHLIRGAALAAGLLTGLGSAQAGDAGPVIAIPGHPDVPVIINGRDASYAVVIGDWGLARPGAAPVVVYGPPAMVAPDGRGYFPSTGRRPHYGRQEVHPVRRAPPRPAPTYHRSWSAGPGPEPVTIDPPYAAPEPPIRARY